MSDKNEEIKEETQQTVIQESDVPTEESAHQDEANGLLQQIDELTANLQRERAEFTNFRKRVAQEKAQIAAQTNARLMSDLLPAFDSFEQFFSAYQPKAESDENLRAIIEGVRLVQKQIWGVFQEAGVEELNPTGEAFDPTFMEALTTHEADVEHDTVSQVFQKGYRIETRIIRPARVVVAKPKQKESSTEEVKA